MRLILTCKHYTRSNMRAYYNGIIVKDDGGVERIGERAKKAGYKYNDRHGGFCVSGCGFDRFLAFAKDLGFDTYETI